MSQKRVQFSFPVIDLERFWISDGGTGICSAEFFIFMFAERVIGHDLRAQAVTQFFHQFRCLLEAFFPVVKTGYDRQPDDEGGFALVYISQIVKYCIQRSSCISEMKSFVGLFEIEQHQITLLQHLKKSFFSGEAAGLDRSVYPFNAA